MFVPFLYELRSRGVPVGTQEAVALAEALKKGLHQSSLDGFYHISRALMVHSEAHLDAFDQAFLHHFHGVELAATALHQDLLDWLRDALDRIPELTPEEKVLFDLLDFDELKKMFDERLDEQNERHDGGDRFIGTGGKSPFGHSGAPRPGFRIGGRSRNRRAMQVAEQRNFRDYRSDRILDVRQYAVALRKLRTFGREGNEEELDIDKTISATADNAGELEIVTRPPRRSNVRVILMMDVGGTMDPFTQQVEQLFSAAAKATHFKEFHAFYFHNCVYDSVYKTARFRNPVPVDEILARYGKHYKLIMVGDAMMAPYELVAPKGALFFGYEGKRSGLEWLQALTDHFRKAIWLNPEPPRYWSGRTLHEIQKLFPMFPLTLEGLDQGIAHLVKGRGRA
ncbi:MAG: VWA domain-containing protein [Vulcanimicrobiota bacterium]